MPEQASLRVFSRWKQKAKRETKSTQGLSRSRPQMGIPLIMPHFLAQSKSQGQLRFKGGVIDHLSIGRTATSHCKMVWIQGEWGIWASFAISQA